jgi:hypothetical protein
MILSGSVAVYAVKNESTKADENHLWYGIIQFLCINKSAKASHVSV